MARRRQRSFTRRRASNRSFALLAVIFFLTLTLAPPVKHYFTQRAQISALNAQLNTDNKALEKARQELLLWQDPEYVKSQARERLHFVLQVSVNTLLLRAAQLQQQIRQLKLQTL